MTKPDDKSGKSAPDDRSLLEKLYQTSCLIATWIALSCYAELYGPTLIDLKLKLDTDYESVSTAVSGRNMGLFPGCIVGGLLVDKLPRYCHLMVGSVLVVAAAATAAIPWAPNVTVVWALCFVGGNMEAVLNIAGTRVLFNVWREKSTSPLMLMHLGYGIGSFIVPLYVNPFLAIEKSPDIASFNYTTLKNLSSATNTSSAVDLSSASSYVSSTTVSSASTTEPPKEYLPNTSRIEYAYGISAVIDLFVSLFFFLNQIREKHHFNEDSISSEKQKETAKTKSFKEIINPASCAKGRFWYGSVIMLLTFMYFANVGGGNAGTQVFLRSFTVDQLKLSKNASTLLNTCYWIGFSAGRIATAVISKCLSVRVLIILHSSGIALCASLMAVFSSENVLSFWVLIISFGFFTATIWPTGIAWTDYHIELTGVGMMFQFLGASLGGIGHLRLLGYLYDNYSPTMYLYHALTYSMFQFALSVVLNVIGARHGSRFADEEEKEKHVTANHGVTKL